MAIYATPCDGKKQCFDNSDEIGCKDNTTSNRILYSSAATIAFIFATLRILRVVNSKREEIKPGSFEMQAQFEHNLTDPKTVNLYLHHAIHSFTEDQKKKDLIKVYDHSNNEAELYFYLRHNFDPLLVQKMVDAKFPGITDCLKHGIEKAVCRPIFKELSDLISRSEILKRIIQNTATLVKIEVMFADIIKDLGLTILMLGLIGGPRAIIDLPTNFGSAIVGVMFASIFLPMMLCSLHLAVNNFNMFYDASSKSFSAVRRCLMTMLLFLLSPIIPVILESRYIDEAEKARKLAQNFNREAVQKKSWCREIKKQIFRFKKRELGIV